LTALDEDDYFDLHNERIVIPSRGINATQAGQFIGVPPSTIRTWLQRGVIPEKARNERGLIDGLELVMWWTRSSLRTQRSRETLAAQSACP
jgi:hypothetical protein